MVKKFFNMNNLLLILLIVVIGVILYKYFSKSSKEGMENNNTFEGPNGESAVIQKDSNGNNMVVITNTDNSVEHYTSSSKDELLDKNVIFYKPSSDDVIYLLVSVSGVKSLKVVKNNIEIVFNIKTSEASNTPDTSNASETNSNVTTPNPTTTYDNYNHYSGNSIPTIFYGENGGIAKMVNVDDTHTLVITDRNGTTNIYYINENSEPTNTSTTYNDNTGKTAKIITDTNGNRAIEITGPYGFRMLYTSQYTSSNPQEDMIEPNENVEETNTINNNSNYKEAYSSNTSKNCSVNTIKGPNGNIFSTYDTSGYYSSQGIPKSQIPRGDEDLYILKSQVVPPVCPKCPDQILKCPDATTETAKCPPCPPCARCPEPAFDCKKVPNYSSVSKDFMPVPVLNDFSTFGM